MAVKPGNDDALDWKQVKQEEIEIIRKRRGGDVAIDEHLIGLALSGGGIRCATFALGIAESLRSKGLLKQIDYLSSVSGGGYLAAWLVANCKRAADRGGERSDWFANHADWTDSIRHLRRYSNYLSPQLGFFSADTWVMATIWFRNTILVQATLVLAIACLLLLPRPLFQLFGMWSALDGWRWISVILFIVAAVGIAGNLLRLKRNGDVDFLHLRGCLIGFPLASILLMSAAMLISLARFDPFTNGKVDILIAACVSLLLVCAGFFALPCGMVLLGSCWLGKYPPRRVNYTQGWVQFTVIIPLILTAYFVAAVLWAQTGALHMKHYLSTLNTFGQFLLEAWKYWSFPLTVAAASLWLFAFTSIRRARNVEEKLALAALRILAPIPALVLLHVLLSAIMLIFHYQAHDQQNGQWFAFVWGPPMVMFAFSLSIVMLIGMMGRQCSEGLREWWSRMGAWLCIYGMAWMLIMVAAVYGPLLTSMLLSKAPNTLTSLSAWIGTTLISLLAGKSAETGGDRLGGSSGTIKKILDVLATVGPFLFIGGLLLFIATAVHWILMNLSLDDFSADIESLFSRYYWIDLTASTQGCAWMVVLGASLILLLMMAARIDINEFSLNAFYRSRLARCYLGATRFLVGERKPQKFTGFDEGDDLKFGDIGQRDRPCGPLHIVNCALNLGGSSDLALHTRHCASFTFTPYHAGSNYLSRDMEGHANHIGYCRLKAYDHSRAHPTLAQVISISGAAASPNMGYHTSPVVAFMLTVFNLRLGWWFPNPAHARIKSSSPWFSLRYLATELFGRANDKSNYLMLSDGGHFENLATYELIRRQCRVIIICDAECDPHMQFESLGNLIRICEVDLNVKIEISVDAIRPGQGDRGVSRSHYAVGEITYPDCKTKGVLIYLKASMTGNEDPAIRQYKDSHPSFPHESTGNQFYGEDQFESYRRLGREVADAAFGSGAQDSAIEEVAEKLLASYQTGERRFRAKSTPQRQAGSSA